MLTTNTPSPTVAKAQYDKEYRAKRKSRKHELIALHHEVVSREQENNPNFSFGFSKRRLLRSGEWVDLPHEYAFILKGCEEFITNPQRFPGLFAWGGAAINNIQCRTLIAKVLACILPNTDLIGGRVGLPTEAGLSTISYDQLQEDYALRWGEYIAPKSFAKVMKYLRRASYMYTERINVCVDDENGTVRSAAGYKQFTAKFFNDLKVTTRKNICDLIIASRERATKKGLRFEWLNFRTIAAGIQEIFNASRLNEYTSVTSSWLSSHQGQLPLSPH
ncbi:hypothetical protein QFW85_27510 (plasmid) [Vibrio chagasii]|uniref:hypothetical protein n=1 Tax=Vibrio TaxID=662 RepID=UPI0015F3CA12|nr:MULTISPECIES: hypothetical protein [Vibrio]HDM8240677.1 hypothetical protein [Vibrio campbellii]HDZ5419522.1 hypothetical protein [Vibrio harveyi]EJE8516200.1 hypothetical protein [Vibrio parahaemolyticus]EJE8774996.1 hypothetical protein [Vibrio parahaemolyticus]MCR9816725.1 hypothetical protein [Vibrio parahaemolyticus]